MSQLWIVVADSNQARIFSATSAKDKLNEIETLSQNESPLSAEATETNNRQNINNEHHTITSDIETKKHDAVDFARKISHRLDTARNKKKYSRLILVASPSFLGIMRDQLNSSTSKLLSLELDKNLTHQNPDAIRKHLPEYLPGFSTIQNH